MDRPSLEHALRYVDSWLRWRVPRAGVPGVAIAVTQHGELLLSSAYGYADVETQRPLQPDDVFRIASHSKTFTATAIGQLLERGRLALDDRAADHAPWLAAHADPRWAQVTVRQLLCHGAGVIRDGLDSDFWQFGRPFPDADQLQSEVLAAELVTDPNLAMKYSNIGYGVLGSIVETVSGQSFAAYVAEHIAGPLGLTATVAEPAGAFADRVVTGYGRRDADGHRRPLPSVGTAALAAATGFAGTAPELCRYLTAQLVGSGELLTDATKREMQRVHFHYYAPGRKSDEDYGLGWILETFDSRRTFGHSGGFPGHITRSLIEPASGIAVSVLTNCIDGPAADIAKGVLAILDAFAEAGTGSLPDGIEAIEGRYLALWGAHDVVVVGDAVRVGVPDSWSPLADADRLAPVDGSPTVLRIADTASGGSAEERVRFRLGASGVQTVTWAGTTMWPEADWPAAEAALLGS